MKRVRTWICRFVLILVAANGLYITLNLRTLTASVPGLSIAHEEPRNRHLATIAPQRYAVSFVATTMDMMGLSEKDPDTERAYHDDSEEHNPIVIEGQDYQQVFRDTKPIRTSAFNNDRTLNLYLNYTITHGMDDRGDYFKFRKKSRIMKPIDFSVIADPPWERLGTRSVKDVDCKALIQGDKMLLNSTKTYIRPESFFLTDEQYLKGTRDCDTFIRQRGYITSPVNEEEAGFPLAFSIIMYKDMELTERLLRAIYRPQNFYCIHVERFTRYGPCNNSQYLFKFSMTHPSASSKLLLKMVP